MSNLVYHNWIFPIHEKCVDADITQLHPNNRLLYAGWLHKLKKGRTWFGLHWDWPGDEPACIVPNGYDTYVFSWHIENWDHDWLDLFCENHPSQQVVAIGEFNVTPQHSNLKTLRWHCWDLLIPYVLATFGQEHNFNTKKKYLVSSLANKPSFTKTLITAYLLKNYHPRNDLLLSWNAKPTPEFCRSMNFVKSNFGRDLLDQLSAYYDTNMQDLQIAVDQFEDTPWHVFDFSCAAFTDSVINLTNETFAQGQRYSRVYPGPCLSEKTWKPLLAGSAPIPVGLPGVYRYLEDFGFCVDYPWPHEFDQVVGDLDRIEQVLTTIDWIFDNLTLGDQHTINQINRHNYEHIRSDKFIEIIRQKNSLALDEFLRDY